MLDNLREQAASSSFLPDEETESSALEARRPIRRPRRKQFLGLTSLQRFIIAVLLMLTVCLLGAMFLLITGKFWL